MRISDWSSDVCSSVLVYSHELEAADHVRLLDSVTSLSGMVVLSGYPHPLYDEALPGWKRVERMAHADGGRERTECLWINPAAVARLDRETLAHTRLIKEKTPGRSQEPARRQDRKSDGKGKSVSVRENIGGLRIIKKKQPRQPHDTSKTHTS